MSIYNKGGGGGGDPYAAERIQLQRQAEARARRQEEEQRKERERQARERRRNDRIDTQSGTEERLNLKRNLKSQSGGAVKVAGGTPSKLSLLGVDDEDKLGV